eukprot:TRINITY_DN26951_c0_g1_i1.p1 TRINITY_DN26951_c0_g1~~TRINITY_DN26951_c0_g1_i1.p1  ORF type:complete len:428 (+),score=56.56 TRINITY_DN26951_c0_g1_i1:64-1347(+)
MPRTSILTDLIVKGTKATSKTRSVMDILKEVPLYEVRRTPGRDTTVGKLNPPAGVYRYDEARDTGVAKQLKKAYMDVKADLRKGEGLTGASRDFSKKIHGVFSASKSKGEAGPNVFTAMLGIYVSTKQLRRAGEILSEMEKLNLRKNQDTSAMIIKYHTATRDLDSGLAIYADLKKKLQVTQNVNRAMLQHLVALGTPEEAINFFKANLVHDEMALALTAPVARTREELLNIVELFKKSNPKVNVYDRDVFRKTVLKTAMKRGFDPPEEVAAHKGNDADALLFALKGYTRTGDYTGMLSFLNDFSARKLTLPAQGYASVIHVCAKASTSTTDEPYATAMLAFQQAEMAGHLPSTPTIFASVLTLYLKHRQLDLITETLQRAARYGVATYKMESLKGRIKELYAEEGVQPPGCLDVGAVVRHFEGWEK